MMKEKIQTYSVIPEMMTRAFDFFSESNRHSKPRFEDSVRK